MRLRSKAPSALRSFKIISHTRFRRPVVRLGIRPFQSSDSLRHEILKEIFVPLSLLFLFSIFSCLLFFLSCIKDFYYYYYLARLYVEVCGARLFFNFFPLRFSFLHDSERLPRRSCTLSTTSSDTLSFASYCFAG